MPPDKFGMKTRVAVIVNLRTKSTTWTVQESQRYGLFMSIYTLNKGTPEIVLQM